MSKIVVIDDEQDILDVLEFHLKSQGHEVLTARSGHAGLLLGQSSAPDLILLDLMLPDVSGTEVCRRLRASPSTQHIPIVMLTALGEEVDRVVGFEVGADDYVVKPFSVRELGLRVRALLGRTRREPNKPASLLDFGELRIDREAHRVWVRTSEIELTALEFKLLVTLLERKNRVQTRGVLLESVWGMQANISTRTVDAHVKRLREKLDTARDYIETVRGVGYRFRESPAGLGGSAPQGAPS
ncbi:MAG: DNA-binding response regulator [Sorangiineae bacterium NIC37A_2]|jgi:two-component system phosphate regulon response regulator PhoB|nr:MAG: DNA-binding response regulator [Sorangiineae bacterium NIC37A_2]